MNFLVGVLIAFLIYRYITNDRLVERPAKRRRRRRYDVDEMRYRDEEEFEMYSYLKDKFDR